MRLPAWLLWAATAVTIVFAEDTSLSRVKRKANEKKIVCYYTNWSVYRPGTAKFSPQNINPYLCTHLIYAFGGLTKDNALKPFDKYQDIEQGGYAKFNGLKTYNKNLKTMVAIGGWNEGSARFSPLVADSERRRELVKNTVKFLRQNHFDGLDLDWEYPSFRDGGKPRDRDNYAALVQELREEFDRESQKTGRPRLLLTMAVPAGIEYIDKGYDIPKLNKYLDWMNILSYDYHSAFEPTVNHHAPLFSLEEDDEYNFDFQLNIDHTVQHYIKLGADRSKLVLGIPTYGRSYTLFNPEATDIGSPADGPGEQGEATREKGYLAYYEICERVKEGGWEIKNPNPEAVGPFAYKGNQWVGYDDEEIARAKAKYVNDNDLGGIMFWSIDNDDFRGKCHGKPYPLIEAAKEALLATSNELVPSRERESSRSTSRSHEVEHTTKTKTRKTRPRAKSTTTTTESARTRTTPAYSTTTPVPPTTPDPGSDFVCKDEGFFPHPRDCKKYFWCLDSGPSSLGIVAHQFTCPSGLVFNKISDSCDYARNVICKTKTEAPPTTTTTTTSKTTTSRSGVITASPPRSTTTTTTTTTTEEPEYEEYEDEEEEDPGTIKELLSLIKKLGGVEQLEKQLNLQDSDEKGKIKPSLYNKFLSGRPGNKYRGAGEESSTTKYVSLFRNRPAGFQTSESDETKTSAKHEKPQYVTIQRNRSTTKAPKEAEEEMEEEEEEIEDEEEEVKETPKTTKSSRRRPSSDVSTEGKEYVTLRRFRNQKEESTTPRYKSILRTRSTTEAPSEESEEVEEDEEKEAEPPQKDKKYSSVIRENKRIVSEVDESKVSGRRGPQYERENSTPTDPDLSNERTFVNNVYTTPKYVEIRRGHSTTEPESITDNVNNVNNSLEKQKGNKVEESLEEKKLSEEKSTTNDVLQRRTDTTTEFVRKRTKYQQKASAPDQTTPYIVEPVKTTARTRGRFRISTTTESATTPDVVPDTPNRFRTRPNRIRVKPTEETADAKLEVNTKSSQTNNSKRRGGSFRSSTSEASVQTTSEAPKRVVFPSRPKTPRIRNQKVYDNKTGEYFTVIFPETTDYPSSEEITTLSEDRITTEPETTFTEPTTIDSTTDYPETDSPIYQRRKTTKAPKSTASISTSTETSVVTSITESLFTERHKISVTKKPVFKSAYDKLREKTTTEKLRLTTTERSTPRQRSRFITSGRSTTPKTETTTRNTVTRSYKSRGRLTTTAAPETTTEKKFDPKKRRGYKKFTESTSYETSDSIEVESIERTNRFRTRGKAKPQTALDDEVFFKRTGEIPRRRGTSRRQNDDLDTQQSGAFYDDDIDLESDQKFLLGGTIKQTSGKDFLNADVIFVTVPSIEEEEKNLKSSTQSLELLKSNIPSRNTIVNVKSKNEITSRDRTLSGRSRKIPEEVPVKIKSFRGRLKAKDSLSNDLEGAVTGPDGNVPVKSKQTPYYYDYDEEKSKETEAETDTSEAPSTTSRTSTSSYRRGNHDYLNNLRGRTRSTTQAPTTTSERPSRRPTSQNDRRRFRPETRTTTTSKTDLIEKSTTNSTRNYQFPRRRARPTISTTTEAAAAVEQEDSRVEESKNNKDNPDLPDLADPAVVAIHNLATVSPGPGVSSISTTPIRVFSESPNFTIHVSPVTESSTFSSTFPPSLRPVSTPANVFSTKHTRPFSSSTVRHFSTPSTQYPTRAPSTSFRASSVSPITEETLSTRSEVIIQPRRQDTTVRQRTTTLPTTPKEQIIQPRRLKPFSKVPKPGVVQAVSRPQTQTPPEYEYYDDADIVDDPLADVPPSALKVKVHSDGYIECLDRGNFPHPFSCKKFISCAKMENNELLGWEYTCPKHLSFDPVGGICNWSAGLGCQH